MLQLISGSPVPELNYVNYVDSHAGRWASVPPDQQFASGRGRGDFSHRSEREPNFYGNLADVFTPPATQRTNNAGGQMSVSRLMMGSRSSPTLRSAGLSRFGHNVGSASGACPPSIEKSKPWWAQNRQPSRLNWRRLGVERASGTITGAYSKCSLPKGAEVYF